ncbi:hypothetical protein ABZP36_031702 [Zizania latifolia]
MELMEAWPPLAPAAVPDAAPTPPPSAATGGGGAWGAAAVAQRKAVAGDSSAQAVSRLVASCGNSSGVAVAVVDRGRQRRHIRRRRTLLIRRAPGDGARGAGGVVKFARETGDLQTLSDVDIKIIALAYMLEAEIHGTKHLREHPPPLRVVNVRDLKEVPVPGWGSNVPNLAVWEELDQMSEVGGDLKSRILPLKDLENQEIPTSETNSISEKQGDEENQPSKKDVAIAWEDDENNQGWLPAVSRNTHRKYLRRKARRNALKESEQSFETSSVAPSIHNDKIISESGLNPDGPSTIPEKMASETDVMEHQEVNEPEIAGDHLCSVQLADKEMGSTDACIEELDKLDIKSETEEGVDSSYADDGNSGMQIRQLHRWVLRCHACYKVTQEIGKIFCPKCGNGGTLRKVSITVGENGITMASRRPRVTLRGTKFSLPMPQGGRDAIIKNPVLREDQLLQKFLHPKSNKPSKQDDDFLSVDDIFSHSGEKKVPLKPPVRKALAMFSGKRNPNDNHFSRKKH